MTANVYNSNWFSGNLVRKYPIESTASCISDDNTYLPDDIITDLSIAYPISLGSYCYISAVNITKHLVSIVIAAGSTPIAACCVSRPTHQGRYYTLDPLYNGVTGLIAIGIDTIDLVGKWIFSNSKATRILETCCSPYFTPEVTSLSRQYDSDPMTGDILLTGGNDIKLSLDEIVVNGTKYNAIFIGLDTDADPVNTLKKYCTHCDKRTEMDTCDREYVSTLGAAVPDCTGDIKLVSSDPRLTIGTLGDGIITIKSDLTLADICPKRTRTLKDGEDECPYYKKESDDICETTLVNMSPLLTMNKNIDLSMTYANLYGSDVKIVSGGIEYYEDSGFTNAPEAEVSTNITIHPTKKVDILLKVTNNSTNLADIIYGNLVIHVHNNLITDVIKHKLTTIDPVNSFHIVIYTDKVVINDSNNQLIAEYIHKTELQDSIILKLNNIQCEAVAYD